MAHPSLDQQLQAFAVELFEQSGGAADWPSPDEPGSVVVPAELAAAATLPGETFALSSDPAHGDLHVGLGGDFLEAASRVLDVAVPRTGVFRISDRYLTTRDLAEKVAQTFVWQNARGRCGAGDPGLARYERWTLAASMHSEDIWETILHVTINAGSMSPVELPELFEEPDLGPDRQDLAADGPATLEAALAEGKRRLIAASTEFVRRVEGRLERDRRRIQDYYRALSREAGGGKRRTTAAPPSPEEIADRKRAVDLELRRKLLELSENYAIRAELRPVAMALVRLPVLIVPVVIQRKQSTREYRLYWNPLRKQFEPLACNRCGRATFSATFTNETVDLLCTPCAMAS